MTTPYLGRLRSRRCEPRSVALSSALRPAQVLARLGPAGGQRTSRDLVCLDGAWAGGGTILAWDPEFVLPMGTDPWSALHALPSITRAAPSDRDARGAVVDDVIGGGWFGVLGWTSSANRLGFYDNVLRWSDGPGWRWESLYCPERAEALDAAEATVRALLERAEPSPTTWSVGPPRRRPRPEHLAAVENAVGAIRAGAIYQVNVCTEISASFQGDPVAMFAHGVAALRPDYGGFVGGLTDAGGGDAVVSLSPELFLRRHGHELQTRPIKGTLARSIEARSTPSTDAGVSARAGNLDDPAVARLRNSSKDAAENVMIVDLMRNDFARVAVPGSVQAQDLLQIQPHAGVWHLVSTVVAQVAPPTSDAEILRACFPPGSVSGAPKLRATRVIADVEAVPRAAYTGALGFISPVWGAELNVLIRTFEVTGSQLRLGVGGGVTAESVPMLEWQECLDKAEPLLRSARASTPAGRDGRAPDPTLLAAGLLETLLVRDGVVLYLEEHLARLARSTRELFDIEPAAELRRDAVQTAARLTLGRGVLRINTRFVAGRLTHELSGAALGPRPGRSAGYPIARRQSLWRHKWAERSELAAHEAWAGTQGATPGLTPVPVFVDESGRFALETSRGNLFHLAAEPDGPVLRTPPLDDDVLPGVTRRRVLDAARDLGLLVRIEPLRLADVMDGSVFWTSALSGLVEFGEIAGVPLPTGDPIVERLRAQLDV